MKLLVNIEVCGEKRLAGRIVGDSADDAMFSYDRGYIDSGNPPISISLPFRRESFSPSQTKDFFSGLLPEGFTKREVARQLKLPEDDYLSILSALGSECIGAVQILEDGTTPEEPSYEELSHEQIRRLASEGATHAAGVLKKTHISLAGASGKVGLYHDDGLNRWYYPHGDAPSTHIIKQSHVRLDNIVINEMLTMMTAGKLGINTSISDIINPGNDKDDILLFSTKRYDRKMDKSSGKIGEHIRPYRLHQEDFSQSMGIPSDEKYETVDSGYLAKMFDLVRQNSSSPIEDQNELWDRIVFDYLIGNTDAHIKNFSIISDKTLFNKRLAPAYDMISTVIYEESTRDMSLYIGGEKSLDRIDTGCFERAASEAGIGIKYAIKRYDRLRMSIKKALEDSKKDLIDRGYHIAEQIYDRIIRDIRI